MKIASLLIMLMLSSASLAVIETYEFATPELSERYHQFTDELRCPKCQNQNLSGSNSPIAEDLRRELHRLLQEGKTDQEVIAFMVERYGDFVLYRPRFNAETAVLWLAPVLFLGLGIVVLVVIVSRQRKNQEPNDQPLEDHDRSTLVTILEEEDRSHDNV